MLAPAPVTFSTMTAWPSDSLMRSLRMRASVSVGPPAGNGTIIVIEWEGKVSARTPVGHPSVAASAAAPNARPATGRIVAVFMCFPRVSHLKHDMGSEPEIGQQCCRDEGKARQ